jgi:alpha-glucosidase
MRTATRFGAGSAKAMLALLCSLRGTILLYQGEELGLPEVELRRDQLKDPVGDLYYPLFKGRDGCRTPMPWDSARPNLGFGNGNPWLSMGPDHRVLAVSQQHSDPASTLNYLRRLMQERKTNPQLREGDLRLLDAPLPLIALVRGQALLCVFNLSPDEQRWTAPKAQALDFGTGAAAWQGEALVLGPWSAWFGILQGP